MSPPHPTTPYGGREPSNADIVRMLSAQDRVLKQLKDGQEDQCRRLEVVERTLLGTIEPPRKGFLNRVRELESQARATRKVLWALLLAMVAGVGTWVVNKFTGSH